MLFVAEQYLLPIVIALLIGLAIGYSIFKLRSRGAGEELAAPTAAEEAALAPPPAPAELVVPEPAGPPDNLQLMKGVGPQLAARLAENGLTRYDQIAALNDEQVAALDARLGNFTGRLARDRVVEQAAYLARGDRERFEAQFGKLGGA